VLFSVAALARDSFMISSIFFQSRRWNIRSLLHGQQCLCVQLLGTVPSAKRESTTSTLGRAQKLIVCRIAEPRHNKSFREVESAELGYITRPTIQFMCDLFHVLLNKMS
jgi:hypothetical protein